MSSPPMHLPTSRTDAKWGARSHCIANCVRLPTWKHPFHGRAKKTRERKSFMAECKPAVFNSSVSICRT
eukprot:4654326-Lingulodinium_polyedra.AAC.1